MTETLWDKTQVYNIPKFDGYHHRDQPAVLQNHIKEIEAFSRKCHDLVVVKLLKLFAILLELPDEDQLVRQHEYDVKGEDHLRYMHYEARSPEENKAVGDLYSAGHTDLGSITLLFRQPVAALQILNSDDQWKWVKPLDASITVNICDALSAMTGGYLKSSVHRVHTPPEDQAHVDRLGVLYFARYDRLDEELQACMLMPLQAQQRRCPGPHSEQWCDEAVGSGIQRVHRTWAAPHHGRMGQSPTIAAAAKNECAEDRGAKRMCIRCRVF